MNKDYQNDELDIVRIEVEALFATSSNIDVDDGDDIIDLPFVSAV
jgi:hypothetical protein